MRRSSICLSAMLGAALFVPTALAQRTGGASADHATALPRLAIDRVAVHPRGLPVKFVVGQGGPVALKRGESVRVTLRLRNLGDLRLHGLRVTFSQHSGKPESAQVLTIRALDPGEARALTFHAVSDRRGLWVLRAGAIFGAHYRNGATQITRVSIH
jgi:hypothetical protein